MPRREPLSTRGKKLKYCQQASVKDAETEQQEKGERHIRFDLSRNQFFFLPSKTQLKKRALAQAGNEKPLLFTTFNTRSIIKKDSRQTQLETPDTSDKVPLIPPDDSQVLPTGGLNPELAVNVNVDLAPFSENRIKESSRDELGKARCSDNGLERVVVNDLTSRTNTSVEKEKVKSPTLQGLKTLAKVLENTKSAPSKLQKSISAEKGVTLICAHNKDKAAHDISSLELLSLLKYPANSFPTERSSRKSSQKSAQKSRYGQHNFSPIRSASTVEVAMSAPV